MSDLPPPPQKPKNRRPTGRALGDSGAAASPEAKPMPQDGNRLIWPRFLRGALVISLTLNFLVIGIVIGTIYHKNSPSSRAEMTRDLGFGPFAEALSPDDRRALRNWLHQRAPQLRSANAQRKRDMVALQGALRADPFLAQNLTAALQTMRQRLEGQLALGHEALIEVILTMSAAERQALADRLDRGMHAAQEGRHSKD